MKRQVVDLKFEGRVIGKATIEIGDRGISVVSTTIDDSEVHLFMKGIISPNLEQFSIDFNKGPKDD